MATKPSRKGRPPKATLRRVQIFSSTRADLFPSPDMALLRSLTSTSCRQLQEYSKLGQSAETSSRRSRLWRRELFTELRETIFIAFDLAYLLYACLRYSALSEETSFFKRQPLHLYLLQAMDPRSFVLCILQSMEPRNFMLRVCGRSVTTHPTATMRRVEGGAHASDDDGTLEGHDHDV